MSTPVLRHVSAFSGIEGFGEGFARAEIETVLQIEWDTHCRTILARHYPHIPLLGDISDVTARQVDVVGRAEVWTAGFPCQGISIGAPNRPGIDTHDQSKYFFDFHRLVDDYLRLVERAGPRWLVIENPDGLLASPGVGKDGVDRRGWDMAAVVRAVEDLGYGWAYRVVDARHLGTTQRRRRVILVGHLGGDSGPAQQVLGLTGAGSEADTPDRLGRAPRRPRPVGLVAGEPVVWRKSARPRKALSKGGYETWVNDGDANTLNGFDYGYATRQTHLLRQPTGPMAGRLRTFTLTEWERLNGFRDDWTAGVPDSARGDMLGNSFHTGTGHWLGRQIAAVHHSMPMLNH